MALADNVPSQSMSKNHVNENVDSPGAESATDWMASAIPVDRAMTLTVAAGIISDEEASSRWEYSPGSATASDASDQCQMRDLDKDGSKNVNAFDDCTSENSENRSDGGHTPDANSNIYQSNQSLECLRSFESLFRWQNS